MTTERFNSAQFEEVLTQALAGKELAVENDGYRGSELRYHILVKKSDHAEITVEIASSIGRDGFADGTGKNSIRIWIMGDGRPLAEKDQEYVTRVAGWQRRLTEVLDKAIVTAVSIPLCSKCGAPMKKRSGKKGEFWGCSRFPNCDGTQEVLATVSNEDKVRAALDDSFGMKKVFATQEAEQERKAFMSDPDLQSSKQWAKADPVPNCPQCGTPMVKRNGYKGPFWGCPKYPNCRGTRNITEVVQPELPMVPAKVFKPSEYQQAIFDWVTKWVATSESRSLIVEALAGSGKTTTGVEMLKLVPTNQDVLFVAFNKHIATELSKRAPSHVKVSTYHSLGYSSVRQAFGDVKVDENKVDNILSSIMDKYVYKPIFPTIKQLVSLVKANLTGTSVEELLIMADHYGIELNGDSELIFSTVAKVVGMCTQLTSVVDFEDMCYFPVVHDLPMKKYDFLFIDECLPHKTPVLLADGTSATIGNIVTKQLPVTVLSYDILAGKQVACKVTGWHKILNTKKLVKVKVKWSIGKSTSFVTCTEDHLIYTWQGYVKAGKLKPGMIVQVETAAKRTQDYAMPMAHRKSSASIMSKLHVDGKSAVNHPTGSPWRGFRGGNGTGMTKPQQLLMDALGLGWESEYSISTKDVTERKIAGYPTCYKVDLANPEYRIAIEIDGHSHDDPERIAKDEKKDKCLAGLGWLVFRFTNDEVMRTSDKIVADLQIACNVQIACGSIHHDCPIEATVVSVEPIAIKDWYVYDIDVEDCHNFYANSILVHNCQDTNKVQIALALKSIKENGRIVAVGDRHQSLYGFRGADVNAIPNLIESLEADVLPLSITYRNPKLVVDLVNQKFPEIPLQAAEWAKDGVIRYIHASEALIEYKAGDMVLCRCNAPLVEPAFALIRRGVKAIIRGRDIGSNLLSLVRKMRVNSLQDLLTKLTEYKVKEVAKLQAAEKNNQAQSLEDKVDTIIALADGIDTIVELEDRIETIFSDDQAGVVFSSVHRAKGLEAEHVYILHPELMPHKMAKKPWEIEQERNIEYVALTRTLSELIYVS